MRVQFNGRTPAFQAGYVGSIPITRSLSLQLSWIEQRPSKPWVGGSNPSRLVLWWVQRSWLARQIVALEAKGSNPFIHLFGLSPSGKAQHFDCCIRWFESSQPSQRKPAGQKVPMLSLVQFRTKYGILAQLVEHLTFNQVVRGSNPRCLMRKMHGNASFFVAVTRKCQRHWCGARKRAKSDTVSAKKELQYQIFLTFVFYHKCQCDNLIFS